MLPAKNRLNLSHQFKKGKLPSKRLESDSLLIKVLNAESFKAAVVVSKKVTAKATERNRIKRLITEAIMEYQLKNTVNLIIYAKKNFADKKKDEVANMLKELLNQL